MTRAEIEDVGRWDVFLSYTAPDRDWAEWVAWSLEHSGYTVFVAAWDVLPGQIISANVHDVATRSRLVIVLLSDAYLTSAVGGTEWRKVWRTDSDRLAGKVIPVRVENTRHRGPADGLSSLDLFALDADDARDRLLRGVRAALTGRSRPTSAPVFPGPDVRRAGTGNADETDIEATMAYPEDRQLRRAADGWENAARWPGPSGTAAGTHPRGGRANGAGASRDHGRAVFGRTRALLATLWLELPAPPDPEDVRGRRRARWSRVEARLDRRIIRAGPPTDEHQSPLLRRTKDR